MSQKLTQTQQATKDGLEEDIQLPDIVRKPYRGPSESVTALTRGALLGVLGFFTGKEIARGGASLREGTKNKLYSKQWSYYLAAAGALLGVYSASKEVRENKNQVSELKSGINKIHEQNLALKQELKDQLAGKGVLTAFKDEWTQAPEEHEADEGAKAEKPATHIALDGAKHKPSHHVSHGSEHQQG